MKKISIIVPVYNTEKYVGRCIESILKQTYSDFELIIINDGSTDNSMEVCEEYAKKDERIIVKNIENAGVANARNVAMEIMSGEYVTFVDSDDVIRKNYLQEMIDAINSTNSQIAFCDAPECYDEDIKDFLNLDEKKDENIISSYEFNNDYDFTKKLAYTAIPGTFYKNECISQLRFDKDIFIAEDSLFIFKALINSKRVVCVNKPLYGYFQRADSATGTAPYDEKKFTEVKAWERISEKAQEFGGRLYTSSKAMIGIAGFKGIKHMKFYGGYDKKLWNYCVKVMRKEMKNVIFSKVNKKIKIQYYISFFFPHLFMSLLKRSKM